MKGIVPVAFPNRLRLLLIVFAALAVMPASAKTWMGFQRGMGIGGWLTNYKRFNVLTQEHRLPITIGDLEHFDSYITESGQDSVEWRVRDNPSCPKGFTRCLHA